MIYGHPDIFMFSHGGFIFIYIMLEIKDVIIIEVYQVIIGMNQIKGASSDSNSFKVMKK